MKHRYRVEFGFCFERRRNFSSFDDALAFYAGHPGGKYGERLLGSGASWEEDDRGPRMVWDGLSDEERERVEEVDYPSDGGVTAVATTQRN